MNTLRWIALLPLSLFVTFTAVWLLSKMGLHESYSKHHLLLSFVWLTPPFLMRALPYALFVGSVAIVAPMKKKLLAIVAAFFALVLAIQMWVTLATGVMVFDMLKISSALVGCGVGVLLAFYLDSRAGSKMPNQPPQRNAGSRPSSDDLPASETPSSLGPRG